MREPSEPLTITASSRGDRAEDFRLERRGVLRIAAAALGGKRIPQRFHQRAGAEHEIDRIGEHRVGERRMQRRALGTELEHVAEHRDAPAEPLHRHLPEQRERRAHRGRVGVVALVDQQHRAAGHIERDALAAPDRRLELGERERREREVGAEQLRRREHAERVVDHVPARRAELVGDVVAEDARLHGRGLGLQRDLHEPRVGTLALAERHDPLDAGGLRGAPAAARTARCRH